MSQRDKASAAARTEKVNKMRKEAARKDKRTRNIVTAVVVAVVTVMLAGLYLAMESQTEKTSATPDGTTATFGHTVKAPGADPKVTVDIYEDFQCPYCKTLEDTVGPIISQRIDSGDIAVNYHMMAFIGPESERATAAGACFADQGKFREFHSAMYANQAGENSGSITTASLKAVGKSVGADTAKLNTCIDDGTFRKFPDRVNKQASKAGVTSTPAVFLNGKQLKLDGTADAFEGAVDAAVKKATAAPAPSATPKK